MNLGRRLTRLNSIEQAFYTELGRKLASKRRERGLHQQDVAHEIGVHRNTLMRWKSGEQGITLWMLLRLCDILSCQHFILLPEREFTWGAELHALRYERDPKRKSVQAERDPALSDREAAALTRHVA